MKMYPNVKRPANKGNHRFKINLCNHTGDECIATFDPEVADSIKVAEDELQAFMDSCIKQYGSCAPVFGREVGETDYRIIRPSDLPLVDDVVIHQPLAGG